MSRTRVNGRDARHDTDETSDTTGVGFRDSGVGFVRPRKRQGRHPPPHRRNSPLHPPPPPRPLPSILLGPVDPSFRALSGRLLFEPSLDGHGFWDWGLGYRVSSFGCGVQGSDSWVQVVAILVLGSSWNSTPSVGFRGCKPDQGFRISSFGLGRWM